MAAQRRQKAVFPIFMFSYFLEIVTCFRILIFSGFQQKIKIVACFHIFIFQKKKIAADAGIARRGVILQAPAKSSKSKIVTCFPKNIRHFFQNLSPAPKAKNSNFAGTEFEKCRGPCIARRYTAACCTSPPRPRNPNDVPDGWGTVSLSPSRTPENEIV
jgi:hypothetical protein